jgi:hypothetical protein
MLGQLHRSPGKNAAWVEGVLRTLQRDRPDSYDRLRRRLGFARRLADLARLEDEERAIMTIGLFFHELVGDTHKEDTTKPARAWTDYLLRNGDWLTPCLQVCEVVLAPSWDDIDASAAVVAKVAVVFDLETLEHYSRPLQVIESLRAEAQAPAMERIIPLLWSEDGQGLCHHHVRRQADGYTLDAADFRHSLELLKPVSSRPAAEVPVAPQRLSARAAGRAETKHVQQSDPQTSTGITPSDNFEQHREALRSASGWGALLGTRGGDTSESQAEESPEKGTDDTPVESAAQTSAHRGGAAELWLPPMASIPEPEHTSSPAPEPREEDNVTIPSISSAHAERRDNLELAEKVADLRSHFDQIQQIAAEGQSLLASLAPQLEEIASWIVELETMVHRWKGHEESDEKSA